MSSRIKDAYFTFPELILMRMFENIFFCTLTGLVTGNGFCVLAANNRADEGKGDEVYAMVTFSWGSVKQGNVVDLGTNLVVTISVGGVA